MNPLPTELRNKLERTIVEARDLAEAGAKAAIEALAVHHHEPYAHMSPVERKLRNHLRAKARQLGDKQNRKGELGITHLIWECAYEHWHRMLFARFLAENDLLIESEMGVAISLEECEELAKEEGKGLWTLSSEFAQRMLPQIFRSDDPILKIIFAQEHRIKLEKLLSNLEHSVFTASDSLGWVYQFWQTKRKKEVNESGNKIGADELPAVTQLFTEPYMVNFLLDNSLGAWWAARRLTKADLQNEENEDELRKKASLPGVPLEYLRFVKVAEASSLCKPSGKMPLPQCKVVEASSLWEKEIGYFHKDEPVANLSGDLPHWRQEGVTYFVTFRTNDSIPQGKLNQWKKEKEKWLASNPEPHDEKTKKAFYEQFPKRLQKWLDNGYGKCLLADKIYRDIVETALQYFDGKRYHLDEFVVMPNHVHALITPTGEHKLSEILHSWKSFTANQINKMSDNSGAFWQKESFDHIVRSPAQVEKIRQYIKDHSAYSGRGFQPLGKQRQDASATIWTPAAGTFEGWPEHLSELKTLDPCCGSGHFLVAAFLMLVPMRIELEGLDAQDAVDAVLRENIHGLEIDRRCVELAAFALALTAWRYPDAGGYRALPELNVACSGLCASSSRSEWEKLANGNSKLRVSLFGLYDDFRDVPILGSLIDPLRSPVAKLVQWETLSGIVKMALEKKCSHEEQEAGVVAQGLAKAAQLLAGKYHWVITNVPYLARGKQTEKLKNFCERRYPAAKNDIATVFLERCLEFCQQHGVCSIVLPQNWLFLTTYQKFREKLLRNDTWLMIARLGPGAFETISGEVVKAILLILSRGKKVEEASSLFTKRQDAASTIRGIDVSVPRTAKEKAELLVKAEIQEVAQERQLENPDARVVLEEVEKIDLLQKYAQGLQGISPADALHYGRCFWEMDYVHTQWHFWQSTIDGTRLYGGKELVLWYGRDLQDAIIRWQRTCFVVWKRFTGCFCSRRSLFERLGSLG
jgi:REP element-mobilizing transposase RayT